MPQVTPLPPVPRTDPAAPPSPNQPQSAETASDKEHVESLFALLLSLGLQAALAPPHAPGAPSSLPTPPDAADAGTGDDRPDHRHLGTSAPVPHLALPEGIGAAEVHPGLPGEPGERPASPSTGITTEVGIVAASPGQPPASPGPQAAAPSGAAATGHIPAGGQAAETGSAGGGGGTESAFPWGSPEAHDHLAPQSRPAGAFDPAFAPALSKGTGASDPRPAAGADTGSSGGAAAPAAESLPGASPSQLLTDLSAPLAAWSTGNAHPPLSGSWSPATTHALWAPVVQTIQHHVQHGERPLRTIQFELDPPELGKLLVRFQDHGDRVTAHLVVQHDQTRWLVESHAAQIRDLLAGSGIALETYTWTESDASGGRTMESWGGRQQGARASKRPAVGAEPPVRGPWIRIHAVNVLV